MVKPEEQLVGTESKEDLERARASSMNSSSRVSNKIKTQKSLRTKSTISKFGRAGMKIGMKKKKRHRDQDDDLMSQTSGFQSTSGADDFNLWDKYDVYFEHCASIKTSMKAILSSSTTVEQKKHALLEECDQIIR